MKSIKQNRATTNLLNILGGIGGINLIILIHEMGHFLFAKFFNIPTPVFSLGFGPTLFTIPIGQTNFNIALLPFGGYVEMDQIALAQLLYLPKMIIIFAGILFNIIFAYGIFMYYAIYNKSSLKQVLIKSLTPIEVDEQENDQPQTEIIGPIGIISMIGKILAIQPRAYWLILAILSLNMGLFNILPLPFFDGGKAFIFTIEALTGKTIPATTLWLFSTVLLAFFILFIAQVTMNDIKKLINK